MAIKGGYGSLHWVAGGWARCMAVWLGPPAHGSGPLGTGPRVTLTLDVRAHYGHAPSCYGRSRGTRHSLAYGRGVSPRWEWRGLPVNHLFPPTSPPLVRVRRPVALATYRAVRVLAIGATRPDQRDAGAPPARGRL